MPRRNIIGLIVLILVVAAIIWLVNRSQKETTATPVLSVSAYNQTKNVSATDQSATDGDTIVYTLLAENQSDETIPGYIMEVNISDIASKATLIDASGASYNSETDSLIWTPLDIPAHEAISKQFSMRINPVTAGTTSSQMTIRFNNEVIISIAPSPTVAGNNGGNVSYAAPTTGVAEWLPAILALMVTASVIGIRKYRLARV
jgi:hypothetical protein